MTPTGLVSEINGVTQTCQFQIIGMQSDKIKVYKVFPISVGVRVGGDIGQVMKGMYSFYMG